MKEVSHPLLKIRFPSKREVKAFLVVLVLLALFLPASDIKVIHDADVDETTGNIALVEAYSACNVYVWDENGNHIFSTTIENVSGVSYVDYIDGVLYVLTSRGNYVLELDEHGNVVSESMYEEEYKSWRDGWEKKGQKRIFSCNGREYIYDKKGYFEKRFLGKTSSFYIKLPDGTEKTIWVPINR